MPRSKLFLTFDDSPDRACPEILDVLKAAKAKATFFLRAGRMVAKDLNYYTMLKRMVDEGHALGVKLEEARTLRDLNGSLERNLKAFQELFKKNGSTFPGFKLARLAWSNLKAEGYREQLKQLGLSLVRWDVELAPNDRINHVKYPNWQGVAGLYSDSQLPPRDAHLLLLYSPHWGEKRELLATLLSRLRNGFELLPLRELTEHQQRTRALPPPVRQDTRPTFYLTFDDGPYKYTRKDKSRPGGTEVALDVLKELGVKATFFLCSRSNGISQEPQYRLVKRMLDEGHALGNHGDDHLPMHREGYLGIVEKRGKGKAMSSEELKNFKDAGDYDERSGTVTNIKAHVVEDFVDNEDYFKELFQSKGKPWPGFIGSRLPGDGRSQKEIVRAVVERTKTPHFGWHVEFAPNDLMPHVNIRDWAKVSGVAATVERQLQDQDILLLHDKHWQDRREQLRSLILSLKEAGGLRTLGELPDRMSTGFLTEFVAWR
jgi:peptidoglycan/xylan/chitin deacetylase (PgdA/CDA1 family)